MDAHGETLRDAARQARAAAFNEDHPARIREAHQAADAAEQRAAAYEAKRKQLLRLVHVGKGKLGLDDDAWRQLLRSTVSAESSKELTVAQLERVLDRLKKAGFKVRVPKAKGPQRALAHEPPDRKIRALWLDLHAKGIVRNPSEAALAAWIKREFGLEALQWLDAEQASKAIEKLKKWGRRAPKSPG
jgi:phage gp16-like protein